jgi:hypothetical protein
VRQYTFLLWAVVLVCGLVSTAIPQPDPLRLPPVEIESTAAVAAEAEAIITGPTSCKAGELVVLDASKSVGQGYSWKVLPQGVTTGTFQVFEDGRYLAFASPVARRYTFVLAVGGSERPVQDVLELDNGGVGPDPDPDPPGPNPPVLPDPSGGWDRWAIETAEALVKSPNRKQEAARLAGSLQGICAAISAGAVKTPRDAREQVKVANHAALGATAADWTDFSDALAAELQKLDAAGKLSTVKQYRQIWEEVAQGLGRVSNVKRTDCRR